MNSKNDPHDCFIMADQPETCRECACRTEFTENHDSRYPFAFNIGQARDKWCPVEHGKEKPDGDMQRLYDTVEKALDDGLFYTKDVYRVVTDSLGYYFEYPNDPEIGRIEGGIRGMEIYYARKAVKAHREQSKNRKASMHIQCGQKLKDFRYNAITYSTALVENIDREKGMVTLFLIKRGSSNRWNVTVGASRLSDYIPTIIKP